jgi:nicotinic acid mononucleotide adenylyltransferase
MQEEPGRASFHRWRGWREIAARMPFAVIDRPGYTLKAMASPAGAGPQRRRGQAVARPMQEEPGRRRPLRQGRGRRPQVRFVWIMGADSLASFHRWRGWREIAARMPFAARVGAAASSRREEASARAAGEAIAFRV